MFTGLIEEIGRVKFIRHHGQHFKLSIYADLVLQDVQLGDSIAINGVCLTVTEFSAYEFTVDVMPETQSATNISQLKPNDNVNLERALSASGRLGGHIVTGHVDTVGKVASISKQENAIIITIKFDSEFNRYLVKKGSITVDGISLTVFDVKETTFSLSIIPHSASHTTLGTKQVGDQVNLEFDILAKYTEKLLFNRAEQSHEQVKQSGLTVETLKKYGF